MSLTLRRSVKAAQAEVPAPEVGQIWQRKDVLWQVVEVVEVDSEARAVRLAPRSNDGSASPVGFARRMRTASWATLILRYRRCLGIEARRAAAEKPFELVPQVAAAAPPADDSVPPQAGAPEYATAMVVTELRQVRGILAQVRNLLENLITLGSGGVLDSADNG